MNVWQLSIRNTNCKRKFYKTSLDRTETINYIITIKQETNTLTGDNTMKKKMITQCQLHTTLKKRGTTKEDIKKIDELTIEIANLLGDMKIADRFKF